MKVLIEMELILFLKNKVKEDLKNEEPVQAFQKRSEIRRYWDRGNCTSSSAFSDPIPTPPPQTLFTYSTDKENPFP